MNDDELNATIRREATDVMATLAQYGPGIVGHLLDDDDNAGQRLRDALAAAGVVRATPQPDEAVYAAGYDDGLDDGVALIDSELRAERDAARAELAALAGAARHPYKGPNDTDASMLREAAKRIADGYLAGGSWTSQTTARVLRTVADALDRAALAGAAPAEEQR